MLLFYIQYHDIMGVVTCLYCKEIIIIDYHKIDKTLYNC